MPSSIVWSENGPLCETMTYLVGGRRGEELVWYNMSQTLSILENYLVVFVYLGICLAICLELYHVGENIPKKSRSPTIFGGPWNLIHSRPCTTPCRLSQPQSLLRAFRPPPSVCEVNLDGLHQFDQWELLDCTGHGRSTKWPSTCHKLSKCHLLACQNGVWPSMNQYRPFFIQTSTLPPHMHPKLTKRGSLYKQNNQLPTKSDDELEENSNTHF
jgi:hypothetical protein